MFTLLITDDEAPVRIAVRKLLDTTALSIGRIEESDNGADALKLARELHPDVILADIRMPRMDGLTFLGRIRQSPALDARVIMISGYDEFSYAQQALRLGATDYLLKPLKADELNQSVRKALLELHPDARFGETDTSERPASVRADEVIEMIHRTIEESYSENISISVFTSRYFFSKEYLSKLFKARYGCGIYEFLLRTRMTRARELLSDPSLQIQEIAARTGYSDTHYFSKAYRNYYGESPTQYRKQAAKDRFS
jgi:YesN/AraC family two-component response regulator